jgi:quercetin dioxygenase-like cupin family protein
LLYVDQNSTGNFSSTGDKQEEKPMIKVLAIVCLTVPAIVASATAQQTGIKRTVLRSVDYPAGYTTVTAIVEIAPGTCSGRHTHPGVDSGYVIQGDFVLKIDGKPEQTLKAGDSYETSPQMPHDACSVSGNKLIDTFVVEKGKPLASPAP